MNKELSIVKKAQNILHIGLSHDWGSQERGILRDGVILKKEGRNLFLYCYKNSFIAHEAEKKGIVTIHPRKTLSRSFKWRMLFVLPGIVKQHNIDLIHFYQIEFIWPLCCFLYRFIEIPLIVTLCSEIGRFYTNIFYRTLIYRVDLFICPFTGFRQNIASHLMVRPKKISCFGVAPLFSSFMDYPGPVPKKEKNGFLMGALFNGEKKEEEYARVLFQAVSVLNKKMNKSVHLELISIRSWNENSSYRFYRELSWEYQIGDWVSFEEDNDLHYRQSRFDLWLGLPRREDLEDCVISSLLCGVPILIPRTGGSMELFESCGRVGEYYKSGDRREFWQKGFQMLQNIDFYREKLKRVSEEMRVSCDASLYGKQILDFYDAAKTRRWAYKGRISRS